MSDDRIYDLLVIGGGINGCGIARDAAGRGLHVFLAEKADLAQGTSSASTKLIHGGLRYLEHYEFRLVREALIEREVLLKNAPHISWPMRFVLPHKKDMRPAWLLRLGLFLYDHLGGREILPGTRSLDLRKDEAGLPLRGGLTKAFEYSDCWVDDARFVVLNAMDAKRLGAVIKTRTQCISAKRDGKIWLVEVKDLEKGETRVIKARGLINAAGPWVHDVIEGCGLQFSKEGIRLVRGSHIVVPKLYDHDRAYFFQNPDGRIFFAIPYETDFTLIGTTDHDHKTSVENVEITPDEIAYLCKSASTYFKTEIQPDDVAWTYSGVRPLYDDGASAAQEATRDYVLKLHGDAQNAPVLNIFGGKITTYRKLGEAALVKFKEFFPQMKEGWTARVPLPGGEFAVSQVSVKKEELMKDYPFVDVRWADRMIRSYGLNAWKIFDRAEKIEDLGENFGATLTQSEVMYMLNEEWAQTAEDILWRRSKLGLHMSNAQKSILEEKVKTFRDAQKNAA